MDFGGLGNRGAAAMSPLPASIYGRAAVKPLAGYSLRNQEPRLGEYPATAGKYALYYTAIFSGRTAKPRKRCRVILFRTVGA